MRRKTCSLLAVFLEEVKCRLGDQHVLKARNWDCNRHKPFATWHTGVQNKIGSEMGIVPSPSIQDIPFLQQNLMDDSS